MRLNVRHVTTYAYDPPADRAALRLRCFPSVYDAQRVHSWSVSVNGTEIAPLLTLGSGDRESIWTTTASVEHVEVVAQGEVEVSDVSGLVRGLKDATRPGVYLRTTPLTEADDRIRDLAGAVTGGKPLDWLHKLSEAVRDAVDYVPGATDARTTAGQALKLGKGVCQDHAHLFIAAARAQGTPARYVVGYLLALDANLTETHAWAEAYLPELGWVGFDPANRLCPTDRYVRLCSGLDSADAAPIRGNVSGAPGESLVASVAVAQMAVQSQTQQQASQGQS